MNEQDFSKIMERLEDFYPNFYAGRDKKKVFFLWYPLFKNDATEDVARAVTICICTLKFAPTVAEIKQQMAESRLEDQPTAIEAFQVISAAVKKSTDRESATKQFNELPPILRKLAGSPGQLISWCRISDEAFQTVVMSAIRDSYSTLARREAKYYTLPAGLQKTEHWRIDAPDQAALPEPERHKSFEEIMSDLDKKEEEYREMQGIRINPDYAGRAAEFANPTENELKMIEAKAKRKEDLRVERLKDENLF